MDVLVIILAGIGCCFIVLAAVGVLKMPDFYMRMAVSTKAVTLGVGFVLLAVAFAFNNFAVTSRVIAIIVFLFLTAPVAAHMIGRSSYFIKVKMWDKSVRDDLEGKYDRETHELRSEEQENNPGK